MPTYQYACTTCDHRFEAVQSFSDDALTECPECTGRLRKVFSAVGVVFKGSGFYRTDSRAKPSDGSEKGPEKASDKGSDKSSDKGAEKASGKDGGKGADRGKGAAKAPAASSSGRDGSSSPKAGTPSKAGTAA